jgi:signal transduction histidine kinase
VSEPLDRDRLAVLVHEVRSPVAALAAIADTFVDVGPGAPDRPELARLALAACRGLERIVVDVVTASVRREPVDPGQLAQDVAVTASLGGARVEVAIEPGLPLVSGDPVRLRQALANLVTNALVHSGSSEVVVGARSDGDGVALYVSDSGIGIPEAQQERIFDPGERLDPERPGSGLGLAVVRAIAEAHGGCLGVRSAPDEGATFTLALPGG